MESVIVKIGDILHKHVCSSAENTASAITIGRAYSNDIILVDPYIGASQLELYNAENAKQNWRVRILDTTNPVFLNNKIVEASSFDLCSGDEITIGRTSITVFSEQHEVTATREFSFTNWLHNHKFKPLIATSMFLLLLGITMFMTYLELSTDLVWSDLSLIMIVVAVLTIIWAAGWALVGHLLKGHHHFFSQLFFTSISFILFFITADIAAYVDYMSNSLLAGEITNWLIVILISGLLLGFNLTLVTYSPGAFRNGLITSICIWGVMASLVYLYRDNYTNLPAHSVTIKPSYVPAKNPVKLDVYIKDYDELFDTLSSNDKG